ncbi:PocR ligand-binding domain-containing protein [Paenibacillus sp. SC116]|uniref:PocR ligand-binding domain-containing protein n=1 Tax=Paenibacillus sp. SC116 TaxID=2968986 RepID=UPI00215AE6D1|nr:PocR ligand-binding domain-containing protein [Paenibacillus sp. SC116]MCR8846408.1 PocR ligand-binding domain-containing protein [Paenibacillus sp. SC116]
MSTQQFQLDNIIDLEKWQKLQDSLSLVTKMAIITTDYKGVPVSQHSQCQSFCKAVRQDASLSPYCQKCDARGGLDAVRLNKPYIYQCHFNIIDIAIPIIVHNQYIGAIMAGQVLLKDDAVQLEQIVTRPPSKETDEKFRSLEQDYAALPVLTYDEITTISDMLYHLCNYMVEEAIDKNAVIESYRQALAANKPIGMKTAASLLHMNEDATGTAHGENTIHPIDEVGVERAAIEGSEAVAHRIDDLADHSVHGGKSPSHHKPCSNSMLQPAFDYMAAHRSTTIKLTEMADLCHLSPSYFSRMFTKETGESFSVFVPRQKMKWAKSMLETTDLSISQISNELGFSEPSYFIKTFKKFEQITPAAYRKNCTTIS